MSQMIDQHSGENIQKQSLEEPVKPTKSEQTLRQNWGQDIEKKKTAKRGRPTIYQTSEERHQKKLERDRKNQKSYRSRKTMEIRKIIELNEKLKKQNSLLKKQLHQKDLSLKNTSQSLYEKFLKKVKQLEKCVNECQYQNIEKELQQVQELCRDIKTFHAKPQIDVEHYYKYIQKQIQSIESKMIQDLASPGFIEKFQKTRLLNNNKFIQNTNQSYTTSYHQLKCADNIGKQFSHLDFMYSLKLSQQQSNFILNILKGQSLQKMLDGLKKVQRNMKKLLNDMNIADKYLSKCFHDIKISLNKNQMVQLYSKYDQIKHYYYPQICELSCQIDNACGKKQEEVNDQDYSYDGQQDNDNENDNDDFKCKGNVKFEDKYLEQKAYFKTQQNISD